MAMVVVTPSCAPDFARFRRLHAGVVRNSPADVEHVVIVPSCDVSLFAGMRSPRLSVRSEPEVLPAGFVPTTRLARLPHLPRGFRIAAINLHRPWPPVRGWILQQILKLAFVRELDADVALIIDSDVMVVRPLTEELFVRDGHVRHYRRPHGVIPEMERHMHWREIAADVLGLEGPSPDFADHVAGVVSWSPDVVRRMLVRVEEIAGRPWPTVISSRLDFSEFILYGEFLAALGSVPEKSFTSDTTLCHSRWDPSPLGRTEAAEFAGSMSPDDIAIHVQSNSGTTEEILDYIAAVVDPV